MTDLLPFDTANDPYLWLEEVEGERALEQVRKWNEKTDNIIRANADFSFYETRAREIYDDKRRIAMPSPRNGFIYNFWSDEDHLRGVWRRSPETPYLGGSPEWETLLDLDALCNSEAANWVWKGSDLLYPDGDRALIRLSDGGKDAVVVREFDLLTKSFVDDGFYAPLAKTQVSWLDRNTVYVTSDFGEDSLTASGYAREARRWTRGTVLADAELIDRVNVEDIQITIFNTHDSAGEWSIVSRQLDMWSNELLHLSPHGELHKSPLPLHATFVGTVSGFVLATLQKDGAAGSAGTLVAYSIADVLAGRDARLERVMDPPINGSIEGVAGAKNAVFVNLIENVVGRIVRVDRDESGNWHPSSVPAPNNSSLFLIATERESDRLFFVSVGMTSPQTLHLYGTDRQSTIIASAPARFDSSKYVVEQHFASSADGAQIPYFIVKPTNVVGPIPTLLYAYGGFRVSTLPSYLGPLGQFLIESGYAYVIANIRGGGEFGPEWHAAALKKNRQRAFDDFHAVASDLKARGAASKLGIYGGSNGGLLVAVAYTQRPELYDAVICSVPLADMRRFHILLAGASWMGEYGNPDDPKDWEYLSRYSPYQNLSEGSSYPPVLFQTSTKDDRVHPGHARKMAARMAEMGHEFDYYENVDGGHGGSADNSQAAYVTALLVTWLKAQLSA